MKVSWAEKLNATKGKQPIKKSDVGGVHYEDYKLDDGYWRYTWVNFTLNDPTDVEVYLMEDED